MENLFTIGQVAKCCDISPTTIRRLEKRGLLTPAYSNKASGYRYYDNHNISKIMQIEMFQDMGLNYDDIAEYYTSCGNSLLLVEKLERQMSILRRGLDEMKLRLDNKNHMTWEIINLPDYICYAKEYTGTCVADKYRDMYNMCHDAYEKGYKMLPSEPLFVINKRDDFLRGEFSEKEINYICCLPLKPECASEETVTIRGGKALSVLHYGEYGTFAEVHLFLGKMIRELGLKSVDYPRTMGLVAPYTGREITPDKYVTRLAILVD
ncbi:MAG: MerR family transcriptional regulator [Oscillospiraceae bacterium]|nr:MerR family transcriptional regulator [Oscillospiraceae bacterium]